MLICLATSVIAIAHLCVFSSDITAVIIIAARVKLKFSSTTIITMNFFTAVNSACPVVCNFAFTSVISFCRFSFIFVIRFDKLPICVLLPSLSFKSGCSSSTTAAACSICNSFKYLSPASSPNISSTSAKSFLLSSAPRLFRLSFSSSLSDPEPLSSSSSSSSPSSIPSSSSSSSSKSLLALASLCRASISFCSTCNLLLISSASLIADGLIGDLVFFASVFLTVISSSNSHVFFLTVFSYASFTGDNDFRFLACPGVSNSLSSSCAPSVSMPWFSAVLVVLPLLSDLSASSDSFVVSRPSWSSPLGLDVYWPVVSSLLAIVCRRFCVREGCCVSKPPLLLKL